MVDRRRFEAQMVVAAMAMETFAAMGFAVHPTWHNPMVIIITFLGHRFLVPVETRFVVKTLRVLRMNTFQTDLPETPFAVSRMASHRMGMFPAFGLVVHVVTPFVADLQRIVALVTFVVDRRRALGALEVEMGITVQVEAMDQTFVGTVRRGVAAFKAAVVVAVVVDLQYRNYHRDKAPLVRLVSIEGSIHALPASSTREVRMRCDRLMARMTSPAFSVAKPTDRLCASNHPFSKARRRLLKALLVPRIPLVERETGRLVAALNQSWALALHRAESPSCRTFKLLQRYERTLWRFPHRVYYLSVATKVRREEETQRPHHRLRPWILVPTKRQRLC